MLVPDVRGALSFRWGGQRRLFPHVPVNFHTATLHVSEHGKAIALGMLPNISIVVGDLQTVRANPKN